jgi:hypothetical protein
MGISELPREGEGGMRYEVWGMEDKGWTTSGHMEGGGRPDIAYQISNIEYRI